MKLVLQRGVTADKGALHRKERAMLKLSHAGALASGIVALLWLASSAPPARADETELSVGHVLACDSPEEVEAVLTSSASDMSVRLAAINDRYGKESCNIVTAAFYKGDEAKTVLARDGIVHIIKVDMVGYRSGDAWMRMAKPVAQYVGVLDQATSV
jgi:hypothetical protein